MNLQIDHRSVSTTHGGQAMVGQRWSAMGRLETADSSLKGRVGPIGPPKMQGLLLLVPYHRGRTR